MMLIIGAKKYKTFTPLGPMGTAFGHLQKSGWVQNRCSAVLLLDSVSARENPLENKVFNYTFQYLVTILIPFAYRIRRSKQAVFIKITMNHGGIFHGRRRRK
jgi:hypothetical protein